jgi:DNA helicase-2/ATP-dependent DNA helicase PcrA
MSLNLDRLNANQREAVLHGNGPLLVLAGAGSGKTSTMAYRIAHLVTERHIAPTNVLGLSFTNKAAAELKERVKGLITRVAGPKSAKGLTITTFHSLCVRMLRNHGTHLGFQNTFTIIDRNDQKDILKQVLRNIKIDDRKFDIDVLLFEFGQAKSRFLKGEEAQSFFLENKKLGTDYGIAAASAYPKYQEQLKVLNAMDFDDLLFHGVGLLDQHAEVRHHYNALFRHVLVDEYQDTNPTQFKLLRLLTERQQNICVVGDDDQSIYSWRGADSTHILEFSHQFPGARTITLDQNYRSTNTILEAANSVIQNNSKRHPKTLWSERGSGSALIEVVLEEDRAEGEFVASEIFKIAQEQKRPWKDFAVLYRSNAQARIFEEALRRYGVPYKIVGGFSFMDLKEVKDVISYWKLVSNLKDDASLRRVINWPARGVGKSTIEGLSDHAFKNEISMFEAIHQGQFVTSVKSPKSVAGVEAFRGLLQQLRSELEATEPHTLAMVAWAKRSLELIGARKAMDEEVDDAVQAVRKWENVEELLHSLGQFVPEEENVASAQVFLQQFLNRMTLDAQAEEEDKEDAKKDSRADQATLLTLHGAKGLEYPVVFLVGMEEGLLPHKKTVEEAFDYSEERRLCYVGITRARDQLYLTRARNRIKYGKPVPRLRSRFMNEIPPGTLVLRDQSHGPDKNDSAEARLAHEVQVKDYLSTIRAMLEKNKTL